MALWSFLQQRPPTLPASLVPLAPSDSQVAWAPNRDPMVRPQPMGPNFNGREPFREDLPYEAPGQHACVESGTIFRLRELLKLQISIAGSLEMARLAFRHADADLALATHQTYRQARGLFDRANDLVTRYAQVAQQVRRSVLPDLQLAVEEQEPSLAVSLLDVVKSWVADMKKEGDLMRSQYSELQESVLQLSRRAANTKIDADRKLREAMLAVDADHPLAEPLGADDRRFSLEPTGAKAQDSVWQTVAGDVAASVLPGLKTASAMPSAPLALNALTTQLFEQLGDLTKASSGAEGSNNVLMIGAGGDTELWKRDVIDLLFMAPGVIPSLEANLTLSGDGSGAQEGGCKVDAGDDADDDDDADCDSEGGCDPQSPPGGPMIQFRQLPSRNRHFAAEIATNSSASLLRALRELRRVDAILQGCSSFWTNMDGTVQRLAQMKDVTQRLVGFAGSSDKLRARFEQRLAEYASFWTSLERLCRQYGVDHQMAADAASHFIRELSDAADLLDTAQSVHAARSERQRREEG